MVIEVNSGLVVSLFEGMADEVVYEILRHTLPEDMWAMSRVSNRFRSLLSDSALWKEKFAIHFPYLFEHYKNQENIRWDELFRVTYAASYLPHLKAEERRLFSLAKEECLTLTDIDVSKLSRLYTLVDSNGRTLYDWIKQQSLLNELFDIYLQKYIKINKDVNEKDSQQRTLLHEALQNNQPLIKIRAMVSAGYSVTLKDKAGETPLTIATKYGYLEQVQFLWETEKNLGHGITNQERLLTLACFNGHVELVQFFLDQGLSANEKSILRITPLFISAQNGNLTLVKLLLGQGANVNDINTINEVPALFIAVQNNHYDVVATLLDANADVNQACKNGTTPIHIAVQKGNIPMIKLLLRFGASLNATFTLHERELTVFQLTNNKEVLDLLTTTQNNARYGESDYILFSPGSRAFNDGQREPINAHKLF